MSPDWLRSGAIEVEQCQHLVREEIALALRWAANEIDGLRAQLNAKRLDSENNNDAPYGFWLGAEAA